MNTPAQQSSSTAAQLPAVELLASGMLSVFGDNPTQVAAAIRARISAYAESQLVSEHYYPYKMAQIPHELIPPLDKQLLGAGLTPRRQRMVRLAGAALKKALVDIPAGPPVALMLAGPETLPAINADIAGELRAPIDETFLESLAIQSGCSIDTSQSTLFNHGRSAGFSALAAAMALLADGQYSQVVVGGVDSYRDQVLMQELGRARRVTTQGADDSFVAGEGACFLVLQCASNSGRLKVSAPGFAAEPGHLYSDEPYTAEALSEAVKSALVAAGQPQIGSVLAGLNGENFGAKEWGVATIRNRRSLDENLQMLHPADCIGDVGAAVVPMLIAIAAVGIDKGYIRQPSLVWASSDLESRSAAVLAK